MTNADRLNLSPDSLERAGRIIEILRQDFALAPGGARRLVVGIAGESGSGKSVAASSLAQELRAQGFRPQVIYQDDYFVRPPRTNHEFRMLDVERNVGAHEVQLDLIAEHIAAFRDARDVEGPLVDYPGNRFVSQPLPFSTSDVLVVEGTYVLGLAAIDVRIFCSATHEETRARREARNRDIQDPMVDRVLALEHRLIAPYGAMADLEIDIHFQLHRRAGPAGR
jgi:uridine kinase